ncbi:MAG: hypothetical protein V3V50_07510 [Gammaproteobacteria bacterium]
MRFALHTILIVFFLSILSCKAPDTNQEKLDSTTTVSGTLTLYLNSRDAIEAYVCFELNEHSEDGTVKLITRSDFIRAADYQIPFSLNFPPGTIKQQNNYMLVTTVAEDPEGKVEITTMSSPVLTHGHPSVLNMAIQPPPEPLE